MVVLASSDNDVTTDNTCKAFTGSETGSNFIYGDADLSAPVTSSSSSLYFDSKECSTDAFFDSGESSGDSENALLYKANVRTGLALLSGYQPSWHLIVHDLPAFTFPSRFGSPVPDHIESSGQSNAEII